MAHAVRERPGLRRMVWLAPDRGPQALDAGHEEVATDLGLAWLRHSPEAVSVDGVRVGPPRVFVDGAEVAPADTLFVMSPASPAHRALAALLDRAGFYLPVPADLAAVASDPVATRLHLGDLPVRPIPTVRVSTGRDLGQKHYEPALENLTFPAIVKPVGLASAWGLCLARDIEDLRGLLSLAEGGEATMVVQPWLGPRTTGHRVFVANGEPRTARRSLPPGGGPDGWGPADPELAATVGHVAAMVPVPFFGVDFLHDGERFWFAGIDLDGGTAGAQRPLIEARLRAYRRGHAVWRASHNPRIGA